ncbi:MAG: hypothetical protein LBR41_03165 [Rickettsiales bacterium]|nr:hypothetical protein [Rickettsiales bacterium]
MPQKFQNTDGTLNHESLLKSYSELEKKIGTMVSVPGDDADDETRAKFMRMLGVPDDVSEYPDNEFFCNDDVRKKFREIGINTKQAAALFEMADTMLRPALAEIIDAHEDSDSFKQLDLFFGGDKKTYDALVAINNFGEKFLPADAFESLCSTPEGIKSIYKMMQSYEPNVHTHSAPDTALTESALRDMMRDPKYWRDNDTEYIRKIENGFKKLFS